MATRIEIRFFNNPQTGDRFAYAIKVDGVTLVYSGGLTAVDKTFDASFGPPNYVSPGATLPATLTALLTHLNTFNAYPGITYSIEGNSVIAMVDISGVIEVTGIVNEPGTINVYASEVARLPEFDINELTIEIIDRQTNERELIEEFAENGSPVLSWDGGDDLYSPFMTSKLEFGILVNDAADGKFLHLLTGDENRYLVKLSNVSATGEVLLLWQGFILPDLYSEPYKQVNFFVKFTAVDMLSALQGKYFDPWYYDNTFDVPYLLASILQKTGLLQDMYVRPGLVNISHGPAWQWRDLNVSLRQFYKDGDFTDLYEILEAVLKAQGLVLYSYLGRWFLDGITRRGEESGVVEVYFPDGEFNQNATITRPTVQTLFQASPPVVTPQTPWKKVNVNLSVEADEFVVPEDAADKEVFSVINREGNFLTSFDNTINAYWKKVGFTLLYRLYTGTGTVQYSKFLIGPDIIGGDYYNMPYNQALSNPVECTVKPYISGNTVYTFTIEGSVFLRGFDTDFLDLFNQRLQNNELEALFSFRLLLNGQEFLSNRPGFQDASFFMPEKESSLTQQPGAQNLMKATFKLETDFTVPYDGVLTLQVLPLIGSILDFYSTVWATTEVNVCNIKRAQVEDSDFSVSAVRDIAFTRELDIDVDITCVGDAAVQNSFGIATRSTDRVYEIPVGAQTPFVQDFQYGPLANINVFAMGWNITEFFQDIIFKKDKQRSVYLIRESGETIHYYSLFTGWRFNVPHMVIYYATESYPVGSPGYKNDYKPLPIPVEGDKLVVMASLFNDEDRSKRVQWKVYGFSDATAAGYLQTLAHACHAVQPDTTYRVEASALSLVFPGELVRFKYQGTRKYIATRLTLNLTENITDIVMTEVKLTPITDITYE